MYTILVNDDNTLLTTVKERIMQRSKLVDNLHFISSKMYKNVDMEGFTVLLEYHLPVSNDYRSEYLTLSNPDYDGTGKYLEYILPFDTDLTKEAGQIEMQLTFTKVDVDPDGHGIQRVRKTSPCNVTIVPISAWSNIIPDSALTALDQKIIEIDKRINLLNDRAEGLESFKVDNLIYDDEAKTLQLSADGVAIGDKVSVDDMLDEGIPTVDLDSDTYSVIEF